ncbi:integrase [Kluyvera intermedia]|uniref:Integrase n=1 Tax=Kluyvera intermedia TaxID=61648 RepID=A0ABX3UA62_KLUIN|nr:site-specific integrase [Kluyvera intermedia]ORJ48048.1 integrase [Kluyvera intermedia]
MAISDSYLKSCLRREREKVEEKADRDGLWVRISLKGSVTFFYRFRFLGKQDKMTIGSYPEFSLKAARDEVVKWSAILARGENPRIRQSLDKAKINSQYTFEELFREWYSMVCIQKETGGQILRTFEIHIFPKIGKYPAQQLTLHNWLTILDSLAQRYSEITRRVISNGRQCYSWAVKRQLLDKNPLSEMSGRDFGIKKRMGERTLDRKEMAMVWRAIDDSRLIERNKILYKLSLFWACRVGELRQAEISHFDFEKGIWTVPWKNHKTGRNTKKPLLRPIIPEVVPLIRRAIELAPGRYVFSRLPDKPMSEAFHMSISSNLVKFMLKIYNEQVPYFTIHDLRRTARTNFSELTEPHIAEIMLGHKLPGVWSVYDKHTYIDEMRVAYGKWWARLMSIVEPDVLEFTPRQA